MHKIFLIALLTLHIHDIKAQKYYSSKPTLLPSKFINGERFYLKLVTVTGDTILGFCDTGGGITALLPTTVEKLNLQSKVKEMIIDDSKMGYILFSDVIKDKKIPPISIMPMSGIKASYFAVPDKKFMESEGQFFIKFVPQDAFLGQFFFLDKAWTIDYLKKEVWVNTSIKKNSKSADIQQLGFKKDKEGKKLYGHPSMKIIVDGDTLDVLLDTGATFILSTNGKSKLNVTDNAIGGSFIAKSVFEKWHQNHPEWKIIEKGDGKSDIIEVPKIKIGKNQIGPVLFSVRPDEAWSKQMISTMDKVVKGAIGGSAFKYLKIKIDYNNELAEFTSK